MIQTLLLIGFIFALSYFFVKYKYSYWQRKGIPHLKPTFPVGNGNFSLPKGISHGVISKKFYDQLKPMGVKIGGAYLGLDPVLVLMDPMHAEDILKKDFSSFVDRGVYYTEKCPMTVHILTQNGNEWRTARNKLSNIFTSAKTKIVFDTVKLCSNDMEQHLQERCKSGAYFDIMETLACYFTDITASVIFGVESHSFNKDDASFREVGRAIFSEFTLADRLQMYVCSFHPSIARKLGIINIQTPVTDFFSKCIRDVVSYRERTNVTRKDFIQMLMELRTTHNITLDEMAAQSYSFFAAGFETSSKTSTFLLLELAQHPEVQDRVREEIRAHLKKHNNDIPYDALKDLTILDQAFCETQRKYPAVPTLTRVCVKEYTFRDTDVTVQPGMQVFLPLLGYARDPEYFPDPLKWDITRFENKDVKHLGYMPFGDGPRNCIGLRFGIMQVKMAMISILKDYKVTIDPNVKLPIEFDPDTFVLQNTEKIMLKLEKAD